MMNTFADLSGGEVIHCTALVYFGCFLCLPKVLLCLTVLHHNFHMSLQGAIHWCVGSAPLWQLNSGHSGQCWYYLMTVDNLWFHVDDWVKIAMNLFGVTSTEPDVNAS